MEIKTKIHIVREKNRKAWSFIISGTIMLPRIYKGILKVNKFDWFIFFDYLIDLEFRHFTTLLRYTG